MAAILTEAGRRALLDALRSAVRSSRDLLAETLRDRLDYEDAGLSVVHVPCGQVVIGSWMHAGPPPTLELDYDSSGGDNGATTSPFPPVLKAAVDHALSCPRQD